MVMKGTGRRACGREGRTHSSRQPPVRVGRQADHSPTVAGSQPLQLHQLPLARRAQSACHRTSCPSGRGSTRRPHPAADLVLRAAFFPHGPGQRACRLLLARLLRRPQPWPQHAQRAQPRAFAAASARVRIVTGSARTCAHHWQWRSKGGGVQRPNGPTRCRAKEGAAAAILVPSSRSSRISSRAASAEESEVVLLAAVIIYTFLNY